jgi:hypothetical protein
MKEYKCVRVNHHNDIAKVIQEHMKNGWHLHTYQTAEVGGWMGGTVAHYLLFEKDS